MRKRGRILYMCAITLVIVGLLPVSNGDEVTRYDGHQILRVYPHSWEQIDQLHAIGAQLASDYEGVGPTDYIFSPAALERLHSIDVYYEVVVADLQKVIDAERERIAQAGPVDPRGRGWYDEYKSYNDILAKIDAMLSDHPELVSVIDIGDTIEGRDILAIRISGPGTNKPAVLFNATQHAREWIAPMVAMYIADHLVYNYDTDPAIQSLVDRVEFFFVPMVNMDGYIYTWTNNRMWRKNRRDNPGTSCDGVDLNRNWGVGWSGPGASGDPCDETYYGTAPFSEPETAALRDFYTANPQIVSNIDYHSYSQLIMSPYGYTYDLPADHGTFMQLNLAMQAEIQAVHGEYYGAGPIASTIYQASGGSVDWCYDDQDIFSFTIELRPETYWQGGFELPPDQILPTCEENLPAALYLAEWSSGPVNIAFPNGLPAILAPDTPQPVTVAVTDIGATHDPNSVRLYSRNSGTGDFDESAAVPLGGNLYEATLPATACGRTLEYYFAVDTSAGTVRSPADAPTSLYSAVAEPIVVLFQETMDSNPGWTLQTEWAFGQPTGGGGEYGGPDPTSGYTGDNVYGYNLYGDYANNLSERHLTTPAIDCSNATGVTLRFQRWLGVEQPAYDHAYVRVSNNGTNWTTIWENAVEISDQDWTPQELDISAIADEQSTVYIRWTMGTTDGGWRYCGWNIDDVQLIGTDPAGCPNQLGDLNCDGAVNAYDIDPFICALSPECDYESGWPDCDRQLADCNEDGDVNAYDIDRFIELVGTP
ncbi:MAG: M14 family zinc carboxypeptidase [Planctomycetota bacterium]